MAYGDSIWEQLFSTREWGKYPPEEVIRFFMRAKKRINKEQLMVLDIGSGIGACSWFMVKEGGTVNAFDGAPSALEKVNELAEGFGVKSKIKTVLGDITKPEDSLDNQKFDILLDNYSLYSNLPEQIIKAFQCYYKLLNKPGFFLVNCFGKKTTGYKTGEKLVANTYTNLTSGPLQNRGMVTFFDREELNDIFNSIGFKIDYTERILEDRNGIIVEKHITCLTK